MNEIIPATEKDIPELISMIHEIYDAIPIKEWFCLNNDEAVIGYMTTGGFALRPCAMGSLRVCLLYGRKNLEKKISDMI